MNGSSKNTWNASFYDEKISFVSQDIQFAVENAETFRIDEQFDSVFSNAALHWMKQAEKSD
ncbi:hypothetical protein [Effusibacillus consociatus]|uniref:Methyltransferase type 11 domain-containing protein n=1 Tax=Effusibacillus consociatus TaxID=1117041 RepID=A0ABV9Q6E2_9BACL